MPLYQYMCGGCSNSFDKLVRMDDRHVPTTEPCPSCGKTGDVYHQMTALNIVASAKTNLTPPSEFRTILDNIKKHNPRNTIDV